MNDFNKNELNHIASALFFLLDRCDMDKETGFALKELYFKTEQIIIDYCDHKNTYECDFPVQVCKDCHKYGDELL